MPTDVCTQLYVQKADISPDQGYVNTHNVQFSDHDKVSLQVAKSAEEVQEGSGVH